MKFDKQMTQKEAVVLQNGKMWTNKSLRRVKYDEMTAEQKAELAKEIEMTSLPKAPFLLYKDGTKPDGLTVPAVARVLYDEQEFFLTRLQRHVLSSFVFADEEKEIFERDKYFKSKFTYDNGRKEYLFTRNAFLTLFEFGTNLLNDVWTLCATVDFYDDGLLERTEESEKTLRTICDLTRIRIDAELFAVSSFASEVFLPPFLWPVEIQKAQSVYKERFPEQQLFRLGTANAAVWLEEFELYLKHNFESKNFNY